MHQDIKGRKDVSKLKFDFSARQGVQTLVTALSEILGSSSYVCCHYVLPHSKITGQPLGRYIETFSLQVESFKNKRFS